MRLIDREDHQKLYMQLYEILKKKIENNEWPVGSQIPTEQELCEMFNVSRATVRTAILELVRQGYLKRQQGKGTFIYKNVVAEGLTMITSLKELMLEGGENFSMNILARTVMMPVDGLHLLLDIPEDKHIIYIKRMWSVEKKSVILQESYIPYHICPLLLEEDIENNSLLELFEKKYGIKITNVKNFMEIAYIKPDEARILGQSENSAAFLLKQKFYSGDTLIMYSRSIKGPNRFGFFIELQRKAA
ncbi:MAG: GntR family transcriptional regulator [Nitrospirae bacterium]|jgi:DNA-binding GntR family transcriptional regulator|nr:GntR family transcriptional regulator [Nitrospirota bacterium]